MACIYENPCAPSVLTSRESPRYLVLCYFEFRNKSYSGEMNRFCAAVCLYKRACSVVIFHPNSGEEGSARENGQDRGG